MDLQRLVGTWDAAMDHVAVPGIVTGTHVYESTLDGAFVQERSHLDDPVFPDAIALIDDTRFHYFDVRGVIRVYDFTLDDRSWEQLWIDPVFSQRIRAALDGDDRIVFEGDASEDGGVTWVHDFRLELTRRRTV